MPRARPASVPTGSVHLSGESMMTGVPTRHPRLDQVLCLPCCAPSTGCDPGGGHGPPGLGGCRCGTSGISPPPGHANIRSQDTRRWVPGWPVQSRRRGAAATLPRPQEMAWPSLQPGPQLASLQARFLYPVVLLRIHKAQPSPPLHFHPSPIPEWSRTDTMLHFRTSRSPHLPPPKPAAPT